MFRAVAGCGCLLAAGVFVALAAILVSGPEPATPEKKGAAEPGGGPAAGGKGWPYRFVQSSTEPFGHQNVMDLYAHAGPLDPDQLKAFCRERKAKSPAEVFYFAVVFDDAKNARFPTTPVTALFGGDEAALKHVRAVYAFNKANGLSELTWYERNAWDSPPMVEKVE